VPTVTRCTATTLWVAGLKVRFATHRVWRATGDHTWAAVRHWTDIDHGGPVRIVDRRHHPDTAPPGARLDVIVPPGTGRGRRGRSVPAPHFDDVRDRAAAAALTLSGDHWDTLDACAHLDVLTHPATPERILRRRATDHRSVLTTNPSTPGDILVTVPDLRTFTHPNWPEDHPFAVPVPDPDRVGPNLWPGRDANPRSLRILARHPHLLYDVATHPATPADVLIELLDRPGLDHEYRLGVLMNPNLPGTLLRRVYATTGDTAILRNPSCPPDLLTAAAQGTRIRLYNHPTLAHIAGNPNTPTWLLTELVEHPAPVIRRNALRNPNVDPDLLRDAARSTRDHRRNAALANPTLPPDLLAAHLHANPADAVRSFCHHPAVTAELIGWIADLETAGTVTADPWQWRSVHRHALLDPDRRRPARTSGYGTLRAAETLAAAAVLDAAGLAWFVANWNTWPGTVAELREAATAVSA
jgi:hypothetical protein